MAPIAQRQRPPATLWRLWLGVALVVGMQLMVSASAADSPTRPDDQSSLDGRVGAASEGASARVSRIGSENAFFAAMARREPRGRFPKYLYDEQTYWTLVGSPDDTEEALVAETGSIEVADAAFSVEPFLFVDGQLLTWNDVSLSQRLDKGYLPIPTVEWRHGDLSLRELAGLHALREPHHRCLRRPAAEGPGKGPAR